MATVGFGGLAFTVAPVMINTGTDAAPSWGLNPALAAGVLVVGILDPVSTQRIFNPYAEGVKAPVSGDVLNTLLPAIKSVSIAQYTDYGITQSGSGVVNNGQVQLVLTPGSANFVEASSVMKFWLSQQAMVIYTTSTTLP